MPTPVPWLFFAVSVFGAWFTYNAYRPIFRPAVPATISFFAGWLTTELAAHHLLWQVVMTTAFAWGGALEALPGQVGLVITLASWVGLGLLCRRSFGARVTVDTALGVAFGDRYREWSERRLPSDLAPTMEWRQVLFPFPVTHPLVERVKNISYFREGKLNLRLDVHRPRHRPARCPALIFVHGGGWVIGNKDQQGLPLMHHLAARGWVCFGINYRLSPRATFPDHLIDVKRAIAWVREHGAEYGADPNFLLISGGSAGGHLASLAALTANEPAYQPGFEAVDTSLSGCVGLYGVYDFEDSTGTWPHDGLQRLVAKHVMKASQKASPEAFKLASPIRRVHAGAPPFLVIHGDLDSVVPVEEARRFAAALREVGNAPVAYAEIAGAQHTFEVFPSLRSLRVIEGVARFGAWLHAEYLASLAGRLDVPQPAVEPGAAIVTPG